LKGAALVSAGLHVTALAALLLWPRRPAPPPQPDERGAVELVLQEQKGAGPTETAPPAHAAPAPAKQQEPEPQQSAGPQPPAPAAPDQSDAVPLPPPSSPPEQAAKHATSAPAPPSPPISAAPVFNLSGTDAESNTLVTGDDVIPASPDKASRNRQPVYPVEAARRGEHGTVILLIHVSPEGLASGVDIAQSSGFPLLDRAARDAVLKWRFVPAVKDGQPIPFDMPFRVVFELN
jgi:protein TonB